MAPEDQLPPAPKAPASGIEWRFMDGTNPDKRAVKQHVMKNVIQNRRTAKVLAHSGSKTPKPQTRPRARANRRQAVRRNQTQTTNEPNNESQATIGSDLPHRPKDVHAGDTNLTDLPTVAYSEETENAKTISHQSSSPTTEIDANTLPLSYTSSDENQWSLMQYSSSPDLSGGSPFPASLSPSPLIGAAWKDPFDSLPMHLDEREHKLFHFYVNTMPACSYGFELLPKHAHNWYSDVFVPEAMKGAIAFQNTIIVHAANTLAWVYGLDETPESKAQRERGLNALLRHRIEHPDDCSDAVISATFSAGAVDDFDPREECKKPSWRHMRNAMEMIKRRGGPAAFRRNRRMAMLIHWSDYIFSGFETHPKVSSFSFEPDSVYMRSSSEGLSSSSASSTGSVQPSVPSISSYFSPENEILGECEIFIDFLHRSERLAISTASKSNGATRRRITSFSSNTLLFKILSSPISERYSIPGERKQIISRLAALMMINAALWNYRLLPSRSDRFLRGLSMKLIQKGVDMNESVEALIQILLAADDSFGFPELQSEENDENDDNESVFDPEIDRHVTIREIKTGIDPYERPWFIGRMLKIAKRLSWDLWVALTRMLLSFLTLQVGEPEVPLWEGLFRKEVLTAPLTMYTMPILRV